MMRERSVIEAFVLVVTLVGAAAVAGPWGAAAGGLALAIWYLAGTPFAIATCWGIGVTLEPAGLAVLAAGSVALVLATIGVDDPIAVGVALVAALGLGAVAWVTLTATSVPVAAGTTVLALCVASYAAHRYELVALGLVPEVTDV